MSRPSAGLMPSWSSCSAPPLHCEATDRTSLLHWMEVRHVAGVLASELGLNRVRRRAGFCMISARQSIMRSKALMSASVSIWPELQGKSPDCSYNRNASRRRRAADGHRASYGSGRNVCRSSGSPRGSGKLHQASGKAEEIANTTLRCFQLLCDSGWTRE